MNVLAVAGFSIMIAVSYAAADTVKFETGSWADGKTLTWVGTLDHIDPKTGIAYFSYNQSGSPCAYQVHVTRILSLAIDNWKDKPSAFPPTREPLSTPLPSHADKRRSVKIVNLNHVAARLPPGLDVQPDLVSEEVYVSGEITAITTDKVMMWAIDGAGRRQNLVLDRADLKQWVR